MEMELSTYSMIPTWCGFPSVSGTLAKKRRTFIPISRVFPNGPNNVTAAATIILGKKKKWERTYLFQGHLVWRYRKCLRRYCLDRGYPTNISQEFNVSTPIEITSAYMHNRRRTLFLFNGTSLYHTVRCLRWLRKSGCSSTETEMQPGLLSSLRSIDAMFTHQGNFYVVHGGSYFTKILRSMKNNIFQHGSIAESWYGCQRKTFWIRHSELFVSEFLTWDAVIIYIQINILIFVVVIAAF